jgi:hypothetical protein
MHLERNLKTWQLKPGDTLYFLDNSSFLLVLEVKLFTHDSAIRGIDYNGHMCLMTPYNTTRFDRIKYYDNKQ